MILRQLWRDRCFRDGMQALHIGQFRLRMWTIPTIIRKKINIILSNFPKSRLFVLFPLCVSQICTKKKINYKMSTLRSFHHNHPLYSNRYFVIILCTRDLLPAACNAFATFNNFRELWFSFPFLRNIQNVLYLPPIVCCTFPRFSAASAECPVLRLPPPSLCVSLNRREWRQYHMHLLDLLQRRTVAIQCCDRYLDGIIVLYLRFYRTADGSCDLLSAGKPICKQTTTIPTTWNWQVATSL